MAFNKNNAAIRRSIEAATDVEEKRKTSKKVAASKARSIGNLNDATSIRIWKDTHARIKAISEHIDDVTMYEEIDLILDFYIKNKLDANQRQFVDSLTKLKK